MYEFFKDFSTREIALLIWIGIFILFFLINRDLRRLLAGFFRALLAPKILVLYLFFITYITTIILVLLIFNIWHPIYLKETIFWFFGNAIVIFFNVDKAKDLSYFERIA